MVARQVGVSEGAASWAVTASLFAYILGALADGVISDMWGRRTVVMAGGFAGGLTLMAISGVVTAMLLPLAVNTTGRSLEATA